MAIDINIPSQVKTFANLAGFPVTGAVKTIYIAEDTNKTYRWTGSVYVEISPSGGGASTWGAITGTLSSQTDLQNALNTKEPTITAGTSAQYYRGDKSFQTLDKNAVSLSNVDNTSDANKPVSTATQTALNAKQDTLVSATNIKTINGSSVLGSGDLVVSGSANPSVISLSATDGTAVTGTTTETISQSLLIPANTFTSSGMLEVVARVLKTGTLAGHSFRIYKNTSNTLTGATLVGSVLSASTQLYAQAIRTFRINSNTLTGLTTSTITAVDYAQNGNTEMSTTFTTSVDNYIIFAIQISGTSDSSVIRMARATKYI